MNNNFWKQIKGMARAFITVIGLTLASLTVSAGDYSQYLEELKGKLATETKPQEVERLKREIARIEELQMEERATPEELLAEAEAMKCDPKDGMCAIKKSSKISKAKAKVSRKESEKQMQTLYEQQQRDTEKREADRREQGEKARLEMEAEQKAIREQERQEEEQQKKKAAAHAKAKSDYLALRIKELIKDRTLITSKPGSKLCKFPESGRAYLFIEDIDNNKIHTVKEYGIHPMLLPIHRIALRKHPKFEGYLEAEILEYGGPEEINTEELRQRRIAYGKCVK